MVFTIEPGLYSSTVGGFRHSDTVVVTEDGIEVLTDVPEGHRKSVDPGLRPGQVLRSSKLAPASEPGLLLPDAHAHEPAHAFALSRMTQTAIGATPMGVFRDVERPVYDELMAEQISVAKGKGEGELEALLGSGNIWTILGVWCAGR